jgi:hypothetical protein
MRYDGCGGIAAKAELLARLEDESAWPGRRIVLITTPVSWGHCMFRRSNRCTVSCHNVGRAQGNRAGDQRKYALSCSATSG